MEEYQTQVAFVNITHEKGSFKEMWQGTNLKRSLIVIGANLSVQISGQSFASKYGAVFLKNVGALDPFSMTCINTALYILVVLLAMYLIDKIGRRLVQILICLFIVLIHFYRPLLLIGSFLQASSMLVMGGLGTIPILTNPLKIAISSMLTVFYGGFCFGWAPIYHVLTAEIPTSRMYLQDKFCLASTY